METAAPSTAPSTPQAAPAPEPVIVHGGDSPATWDELDRVTATPKAAKEPKETKQEPKETKAPKEAKESPKEEKVEVKGSKDKKTEGIEKADIPAKLLKLKSGESELDVASDALVPVKIDGKVVEVPLQEALNRYSQQSHLDKLYKTYKTEKDGFEKQRDLMSKALERSQDLLVNQKDLRGFLEYISEAMGVDGEQIYQETVGSLQKQLEELSTLSPEERRIRELEQEVTRFKGRKEAEVQAKEQAKSRAALEGQVSQVMQKHGMDKAALVKAWDDLAQLGHNPDEITPEFLGAYYANTQKIATIESKLAEINPELVKDTAAVESLATFAIQTDASSAEIEEAIAQIYGKTPERKLSEKIEKNQKASAQKGSKSQKNPGSDPLFFDDI
jgi:hypothetical protein